MPYKYTVESEVPLEISNNGGQPVILATDRDRTGWKSTSVTKAQGWGFDLKISLQED